MFVVLISFPPIKVGKVAEFHEWFTKSNETCSTQRLYQKEAPQASQGG